MNRFDFRNKRNRIVYPLLLLLIPLIGMFITNEINWSLFDFIIMGSLILSLSIGINFTLDKSKNCKRRIFYLGLIGIAFLLIWAELAVGIFGTPLAGN